MLLLLLQPKLQRRSEWRWSRFSLLWADGSMMFFRGVKALINNQHTNTSSRSLGATRSRTDTCCHTVALCLCPTQNRSGNGHCHRVRTFLVTPGTSLNYFHTLRFDACQFCFEGVYFTFYIQYLVKRFSERWTAFSFLLSCHGAGELSNRLKFPVFIFWFFQSTTFFICFWLEVKISPKLSGSHFEPYLHLHMFHIKSPDLLFTVKIKGFNQFFVILQYL